MHYVSANWLSKKRNLKESREVNPKKQKKNQTKRQKRKKRNNKERDFIETKTRETKTERQRCRDKQTAPMIEQQRGKQPRDKTADWKEPKRSRHDQSHFFTGVFTLQWKRPLLSLMRREHTEPL